MSTRFGPRTGCDIIELQEQLLAQERELDDWERTLLAREHGMVEPSALSGGRTWSATLLMTVLELLDRTMMLDCKLLPPIGGAL
jgi:hypothetical protein